MSDEELDLVTTEELVNALRRRTKAVVIAELRDLSGQAEGHSVWYGGGRVTCVGLAEQARHFLLNLAGQGTLAEEE